MTVESVKSVPTLVKYPGPVVGEITAVKDTHACSRMDGPPGRQDARSLC
jgi:hypothetical protein